MKILAIDFETYWDQDYTLKKMTTDTYVLDPRFKVHMMGLRDTEGKVVVFPPALIPLVLQRIDWANTAILCHNTAFDGFILKHHYGVPDPKLWLDTLSMARPVIGANSRHSLDALAKFFELPPKGDELALTKGVRDLSPDVYAKVEGYCANDVRLNWSLFERLFPGFPMKELRIIDLHLRMFLNPKLWLDTAMLEDHLVKVRENKENLLERCGLESREVLMSNPQFAVILEALGVEPPIKISKTTGEPTYAFAKNDPAFKELLEHEDERVANLVAARMGVKSTIEETRTERLLTVARANRPWPVLLNYYGAMTSGRSSGGNKQNPQNLGRKSVLRQAIVAPPGYKVCAVDSAQIEARGVATVAGQQNLMQSFRNKEDIYSQMATDIYGRPINRKRKETGPDGKEFFPDFLEGFVGKTAILGLGYGMGPPKFQLTLKTGEPSVEMPLDQCEHIVYGVYRRKFDRIPELWETMGYALNLVYEGVRRDFGWFSTEPGGIRLAPTGFLIPYQWLKPDGKGGWTYWQKGRPSKLYGAKATENLIQALARCVVTDQMVEIMRGDYVSEYGHELVMFTHDELVFVVPEDASEAFNRFAVQQMSVPPVWAPEFPVAAEGATGYRYSEAK
jgi:hypothetical protein